MAVKRNDPCPCGSGKKYKKCCMEKEKNKTFSAKPMDGSSANAIGGLFQKAREAKKKEEPVEDKE